MLGKREGLQSFLVEKPTRQFCTSRFKEHLAMKLIMENEKLNYETPALSFEQRMSKWKHKDEWKLQAATFCIIVSRHSGTPLDSTEGENMWAVYAYIYPDHPHFGTFKKKDIFQDATRGLPLHWGCTFIKHHMNEDGKITSVQVGADYHHLYDSHYTHYKTQDDASEVFSDAQELFDHLEGLARAL